MTGEDEEGRPGALPGTQPPQPGGRAPAPGQLALVQAFINTHYDLVRHHGADIWRTPEGLRRWLRAHELIEPSSRVGGREREQAIEAREALRGLAAANRPDAERRAALRRLNRAADGAGAEVRFEVAGPRHIRRAPGSVSDAIGLILAITAAAMLSGEWQRLKVCPGEECGWAFYDASRNGSGRWCSMSVCGGRAKARAHYVRFRRGAP